MRGVLAGYQLVSLTMLFAVDAFYTDDASHVAGVTFDNWQDCEPTEIYTACLPPSAEYQPGQFYKRELPCILALIEQHNLVPDVIVIDGYVFLDGISSPGLGKYLHESLDEIPAIVGVAKNPFRGTTSEYQVLRGQSTRPLYVTSVGITLADAKRNIQAMHGPYRMPTLLALVDAASKDIDG